MNRNAAILNSRRSGGFTLIEIMVVIGIIAVLAAISIAVGVQAKIYSEKRYTATTLTTLNNLMRDYLEAGNLEPQADATSWVVALSAFQKSAAVLQQFHFDTLTHTMILDGFPTSGDSVTAPDVGTPIRYVPSSGQKLGYFWSAGADHVFGTSDDMHSYDAP